AINGANVLSNFDAFAAAGGAFKAVDKTVLVTVTTGQLAIVLTPVAGEPGLNGLSVAPVQTMTAIRVNAGGSAYVAPDTKTWATDTGYTGGNAFSVGNAIANTTTPALYQSVRWNSGPVQYQFA